MMSTPKLPHSTSADRSTKGCIPHAGVERSAQTECHSPLTSGILV